MLGYSFDSLEPRQYGLRYDKITLHVEAGKVYSSGRYFVGLGRRFINFPRNSLYLEFSDSSTGGARNGAVEAWTNDGQNIKLSVSFYYRLQKGGIEDLYFAYNEEGWKPVIEDIAAEAFREVSTQFTAEDFFTQRNRISEQMQTQLVARLDGAFKISADVLQFNFLEVEIPSQFEAAVESRVIVSQEVQTIAGPQRQTALTGAEIQWISANATRARRIIFAEAQRQAAVTRARASAGALSTYSDARGKALAELAETLGWSNSTAPLPREDTVARLLRYQWYKVVQQGGSAATDLLVNYPKAVLATGGA